MALILLIEDDTTTRHLIAALLSTSGHVLIEAEDGRAGLQRLKEAKPDLIITDIVMPEIEGLELIRHVRRRDQYTPIMAMSGRSEMLKSVDYLGVARVLGADAILRKPFAPQDLSADVERLLSEGCERYSTARGAA